MGSASCISICQSVEGFFMLYLTSLFCISKQWSRSHV